MYATLVSLALVALSPLALRAQQTDRVTFRTREIAVYNLAGRLHVTGGNGATATITRHGRDAARLQIETGTVRNREALRVIYPSDQIRVAGAGRRSMNLDLRVRDDGTFDNDDDTRGRGSRSYRDDSGHRVRISSDRGNFEASADIDLQVPSGTSLRLHLAAGDVTVTNIDGDLSVNAHSGDVDVSDVKGTVVLESGSGHTNATNITGDITLDTGSGNVTARNLSGPSLKLDTGSGDVTLDGASADKMLFDTGSGAVKATGLRVRTLSMDTGSGGVRLALLTSPESLHVESGSGDVTLTLPANFSATLHVETGSGRITSEFEMQMTGRSRDNLVAKIGSGTGRVTIETGSGNVRLLKAN